MSRRMFYPSMIFTFVLVASSTTFAQIVSVGIEIHGQVRYANGGIPADNVLVRVEGINGGGTVAEELTDRSGKFRFSSLSRAQYMVTARAPGYKDAQRQVDLQTAISDYVLLQLVPANSSSSASTGAPLTSGRLVDANVPIEAQKEFDQGEQAINKEKIEEGIGHLEKAVNIYPNYLRAQLLLGTAYMDTRQWDKAEQALRRAQAINPQSNVALFALGEVYRRQKKFAAAEKVLEEGLKLNDRSSLGHFTLGRVYWEKGEIAKAGPQVGRALQLKPDFAEAHLLAGNILLRARQPANALTEFQEYLRLTPNGEFAEQARAMVKKINAAMAGQKK